MTSDLDRIKEALHVLYAYTSDDANPPGRGRSETHAEGRAALASVRSRLEAMESALQQFVDAWWEWEGADEPFDAAAGEAMKLLHTVI